VGDSNDDQTERSSILNPIKIPSTRITKQRPFKKEYLLASGIPVFSHPGYGLSRAQSDYTTISMANTLMRNSVKTLNIREELFYEETPKFDLILRMRKKRRKK